MTAREQKRSPQPTPSVELLELLALRRVASGGVALFEGTGYLHRGRPMPATHDEALDQATLAGLVLAAARDGPDASRRLTLTEAGSQRLAALEEQRHLPRPGRDPGCSAARTRPVDAASTPGSI